MVVAAEEAAEIGRIDVALPGNLRLRPQPQMFDWMCWRQR